MDGIYKRQSLWYPSLALAVGGWRATDGTPESRHYPLVHEDPYRHEALFTA